ncbi:MAG: flagellar basal body protein FliL [Treponema sp.]|jgi:flagellar basal body-associated protein FliL|nr:flagellar basal body protein FliL [Treponema sp.]
MKRVFSRPSQGLLITYRILIAVILFFIVLLSIGSFYALVRGPDSKPLFRIGGPGNQDSPAVSGENDGNPGAISVFNGIGRLRIPVAGYPPAGTATLILSIAFPYPVQDRPFTEELASHIGDFRTIATEYFSSQPVEKITNLDEEAAKTEILRRYNALLRLGRITALYFNDLMIIQ